MRITAAEKERTRKRILEAAHRLFSNGGFAATSTRALAREAEIGVGTLFNYFASKELLALELVDRALDRGEARFRDRRRTDITVEEDLFDHLAAALRELEPYRASLPEILESTLGPFARADGHDIAPRIRDRHLETVAEIFRQHGIEGADAPFPAHLIWTLTLGFLGAWPRDTSPGGQDSWVLLDQTMSLLARTIAGGASDQEVFDGR